MIKNYDYLVWIAKTGGNGPKVYPVRSKSHKDALRRYLQDCPVPNTENIVVATLQGDDIRRYKVRLEIEEEYIDESLQNEN